MCFSSFLNKTSRVSRKNHAIVTELCFCQSMWFGINIDRETMCFHKNSFLGTWACQKSFFSNMHNFVFHASFRSSKKPVKTNQSKTPCYETPNWLFCPLFGCLPLWLHERFWCLFYLFWCLLFRSPKPWNIDNFSTIVDDYVNRFSPRCSRKTANNATYWAEEKMLLTSVKSFSCNKTFNTSQR